MSNRALTVPAEWKAPSEDGQFVIWPDPAELIVQTRQNHGSPAWESVRIQNALLRDLRLAQRRWLGHADDSRPLIATGHQVELYHPGVWVKDVLIDELAGRLDGVAYHFAVDTDAPKHLHLRWPGGSWPITDDPDLARAAWAGLLEAPSPAHLDSLRGEFDRAAVKWDFVPLLGSFIDSMKRLSIESPGLAGDLVNAIHELDWNLGLRHQALLACPIWQSPGYLAFAHHIAARAGDFAASYNGALAEYRREMNVRNPGRPWPDLKVSADACETPFWLDDLAGRQRSRSCVKRTSSGWAMQCDGEQLALDPTADAPGAAQALGRFLAGHSMRLAPRAMTLTMFLRMFVADQFVHGIGGGRYERATDRVIRRFFGIDPPGFCVTTATLLFPGAGSRDLVDLSALRIEGRRLRHGWGDPAKRDLVRRIALLGRKTAERRQLYRQMHEGLAAAMQRPPYADWQVRFGHVQHLQAEQSVFFDRELFFAIQNAGRLQDLIARYRQQLA